MEIEETKKIIEAILFGAGRVVTEEELVMILEKSKEDIKRIIQHMQEEYQKRGIEIIKVGNGYQLCTKKEYYEYVYPVVDKRNKPKLSGASLEVLAIIAYNENITRADVEAIRGVSSDASIYKLMEFGLIEEAGKLDLPGKPMSYKVTNEFLRLFGYENLESLPDLPRYKMDENNQIIIEELVEKNKNSDIENGKEESNKQESIGDTTNKNKQIVIEDIVEEKESDE